MELRADRPSVVAGRLETDAGTEPLTLPFFIVEVARERDLDPLLVSVVVRHESSFWEKERTEEGAVGEQGLMQLHGEVLAKAIKAGYDLSTSRGQLQGGSDYLAECLETCSSTGKALAKYQTGKCRSQHGGPKLRLKRYRRLIAKGR